MKSYERVPALEEFKLLQENSYRVKRGSIKQKCKCQKEYKVQSREILLQAQIGCSDIMGSRWDSTRSVKESRIWIGNVEKAGSSGP